MSKYANAGELRIPVRFYRVVRTTDAEGFSSEREVCIFGQDQEGRDQAVLCKWVNAHGTEVLAGMQLQLREPATLTLRFSPLIDQALLVYRNGDPAPYEVISVDNVEGRCRWLEIKVQRKEAAR